MKTTTTQNVPNRSRPNDALEFIRPDWPAPPSVNAVTTTRTGGSSAAPYHSLNLGDHVGDDAEAVQRNRARVRAALGLPAEPLWLKQVHGKTVVDAAAAAAGCAADGGVTDRAGVVCAVLSADCLPIFVCNRAGTTVGMLHAGWRGLASGVVEAGVHAMRTPAADLLVWLGPAIAAAAYEVGDEVRAAFIRIDAGAAAAFAPHGAHAWLADLYALARRRLNSVGVNQIYGGDYCTARQSDKFFSYRRDGVTGRMASLIWLA